MEGSDPMQFSLLAVLQRRLENRGSERHLQIEIKGSKPKP